MRVGVLIGDRRRSIARLRAIAAAFNINVVAAVGARRGARRSRRSSPRYARRCAESQARVYAACDRLGLRVLAERGQLRADARRRPRAPRSSRRCAARGIHVRDRSTRPGYAGCIRITAGVVEHTEQRRWRRWRTSCAPWRDRPSTRPKRRSSVTLGLDGHGRYDVRTGIRFLDHMLELFTRHGGFDLTLAGDRRSRRRSAPHRRGRRHRARRGGAQALGDRTRHQPRRLLRHADGRDAGRGGDRSRRPAARRRRSEAAGAAGRRPADRAGPRLLRRLRDRRARQRARQGAVRPLEPSPRRGGVQGVRARAARRVRKDTQLAKMLPSTKGAVL